MDIDIKYYKMGKQNEKLLSNMKELEDKLTAIHWHVQRISDHE